MENINFISGYPRSGSTLLVSILNQNPRFQSEITDGLLPILKNVWKTSQEDASVARFVDEDKRKSMLRAVTDVFYANSRPVVFNTNRAWTANMPLMQSLFPGAKVIAMVRNVVNVLNSFEVLHQKNPMHMSRIYSQGENGTVYRRTHDLMSESRPVMLGLGSLKEGLSSLHANKILMIDYVTFCAGPEQTMRQIYKFLGEEYFDHDFNNVQMSRAEYDEVLRVPGLHDVRLKVEYKPEPMLLPKDLQDYYDKWNITTGVY